MRHDRIRQWPLVVGLLGALAGGEGVAAQSSSPSYRLHLSSLNESGGETSSGGFRLTASLGQELAIGTSAGPCCVLQSGFWSFTGSGLVPVLLTVASNPVTEGEVDLNWSGNNAAYDVYVGDDCGDVFGAFLLTTPANVVAGLATPSSPLVCFNVLAVAPGPSASSPSGNQEKNR